mmetsp:Transcript_4080/g.11222  ORF Transcript_4080/g.11222 Transcript_4080/m.11222 type:complete len:211 (-) Transcript_4080:1061-1693(-)
MTESTFVEFRHRHDVGHVCDCFNRAFEQWADTALPASPKILTNYQRELLDDVCQRVPVIISWTQFGDESQQEFAQQLAHFYSCFGEARKRVVRRHGLQDVDPSFVRYRASVGCLEEGLQTFHAPQSNVVIIRKTHTIAGRADRRPHFFVRNGLHAFPPGSCRSFVGNSAKIPVDLGEPDHRRNAHGNVALEITDDEFGEKPHEDAAALVT